MLVVPLPVRVFIFIVVIIIVPKLVRVQVDHIVLVVFVHPLVVRIQVVLIVVVKAVHEPVVGGQPVVVCSVQAHLVKELDQILQNDMVAAHRVQLCAVTSQSWVRQGVYLAGLSVVVKVSKEAVVAKGAPAAGTGLLEIFAGSLACCLLVCAENLVLLGLVGREERGGNNVERGCPAVRACLGDRVGSVLDVHVGRGDVLGPPGADAGQAKGVIA